MASVTTSSGGGSGSQTNRSGGGNGPTGSGAGPAPGPSGSTTTANNGSGGGSVSGTEAHGYCLTWKFHPNNLLHMFNQLLLNESFTDVIVACEGKVVKCHKMVLSASSKYFEQVFCEYPQQNSTLVILKDMKFSDVQAIIEFMYQGEINVAHDQLPSLLKAAESLQVKGLADISGDEQGATAGPARNNKDESNDYMGGDTGGVDSAPPSPPSPPNISINDGNSEGAARESTHKRKRGRPVMSMQMDTSMDGLMNLQGGAHLTEEESFENSTVPVPSPRKMRKVIAPSGEIQGADMLDQEGDDDDGEVGESGEVTMEDIQNIVKITDYIEKGGFRSQFWDEPTTKKIMNAILCKKMEMKAAAENLGVSYSTLYYRLSRHQKLHGYRKMPHTQDTNFNYYQVSNLHRAGIGIHNRCGSHLTPFYRES